jgi:hypothetical protein
MWATTLAVLALVLGFVVAVALCSNDDFVEWPVDFDDFADPFDFEVREALPPLALCVCCAPPLWLEVPV